MHEQTAIETCSAVDPDPYGIRIRTRIGSGFNGVPGSGFTILIRIQEGKNEKLLPKTEEN
jgi:hypothetical protein